MQEYSSPLEAISAEAPAVMRQEEANHKECSQHISSRSNLTKSNMVLTFLSWPRSQFKSQHVCSWLMAHVIITEPVCVRCKEKSLEKQTCFSIDKTGFSWWQMSGGITTWNGLLLLDLCHISPMISDKTILLSISLLLTVSGVPLWISSFASWKLSDASGCCSQWQVYHVVWYGGGGEMIWDFQPLVPGIMLPWSLL